MVEIVSKPKKVWAERALKLQKQGRTFTEIAKALGSDRDDVVYWLYYRRYPS